MLTKKELNEKTKKLRLILENAFVQEGLDYDSIHPSYNSVNNKNDDEILFITCYVEKMKPFGIHIDNRIENDKWVIDIVIMKPELAEEVISILQTNGFNPEDYHGECHGEFAGHRKLLDLDKNIDYNTIKDINVKVLKLFQ